MDRREDGAAFPIVGEDRVSEWVDEMGAAYTAGAHVLWVITAEPRPTLRASFGDSDDLRLGYVHRAAELLRDRPERASVISRIHRFFDDARSGHKGEMPLESLRADVLADVLASRAQACGVHVRVERPLLGEERACPSRGAGGSIRLVAASPTGPTRDEE
ncbi:MAG: hypothetical protein NTY63_03765 [Candidatus Bipolaricaulota bacterium]|nr:hypothetical protein [Candidatus Bipolaricaulota bacterium]